MSSKWTKPLVLMLAIVILLVIAGSIHTGDSDGGSADASADATGPAAPMGGPGEGFTGWYSEGGRSYYYVNGAMQKDTVVGSDAEGYFYVDASGAQADGLCNALTVNGTEWNVIEGKATRVSDEWDQCLHSALTHVGKCTDSTMTREQKLRAAFTYIQSDEHFLEGVLHDPPYNDLDWPVVCANDLFVEGMGDCFSYGAAFAFMGEACGYENCYACNSGGHGWAEIDGKAYDPEWDMHHKEYNHFGVSPGDDCDVAYFTTLTEGVDWMYMNVAQKIPQNDNDYE